jgi:iron complex outermembrane recepter protein
MKKIIQGVSFIAIAAGGLVMPAFAQTGTPAVAEADADTIIVTARKREENLQDVPLSVSAFTSDRIEQSGLKSVGDIAQQTLGFSFKEGFGRNADRPVIRGMANIQGNANAAFFVDGVFVTGSIASYQLDNLERVEVVKGPQSALYGRSTFAGAINYVTRKPDNEFRGKISATGGTDEYLETTGFVSGPIIKDKLFIEANARYYNFGGQYANAIDRDDTLGRQRSYSFGTTVRFKPIDALDIVARVGWAFDRDGHYPIGRIGRVLGQTLPVANALVLNPGGINCFLPQLTGAVSGGRPVAATRVRGYRCGEIQTPSFFALNSAEYRAAGFPDGLSRDLFRSSIRADLDVNDWTFTVIGAINSRKQIAAIDQDYSDLRSLSFETIDGGGSKDKQFEFRITSPAESRIRGIAGIFYYDEKDNASVVNAAGRVISGNFSSNLNVIVPNPVTGVGTITRSFVVGDSPNLIIRSPISRGTTENKAVFGQLEFDLTDTLTASVEGRYQEEIVSSIGTSTATVTVAGVPTVFSRAINETGTYKSFLPRATVDWKITPDALLYAVVGKGNKPGGINAGLLSAIYDDTEVARFRSLGITTFKEEKVWSYEIGAKTSWFDNRLTVNAAAFLLDWNNQQLTQTFSGIRRDGVPAQIAPTVNVGKSRIKGFEIELNGKVTDDINVRIGYALTDAKIRDFVNDDQADLYITAADIAALNATAPLPTGTIATNPNFTAQFNARLAAANALIAARGQAAGQTLPRTPRNQVQGSIAWSHQFSSVRGFARADYSYEGRRFTQIDNLGWAGNSHTLNLRGGIELNGGFTLAFFVTNLLNDRTPVDTLRSIDNAQTVVRPGLRPSEGVQGASTIRDFPITAPRLRNFGVTASFKW